MCARYERAIAAKALEDLIRCALMEGAEDVPAMAEVLPTNPALIVADFGDGMRIAPAIWGIKTTIQGKSTTVFNARVERLAESPLWRGIKTCWMPATGWYEWQDYDGRKKSHKKPKYRMGPASGEPFVLRAMTRFQEGVWRVAFVMQDAPSHLHPIHDRAPFPYPLSVIKDPSAASLLDRCSAVRLTTGDAPADWLTASDERVAQAVPRFPG